MADYSAPVQTFSSPSYNVDPVVKRTGKGFTPLDMLELVQTARGMTSLQKEQALLEPSIEAGKAASRSAIAGADTAEIGTNTARLENQLKHQNYASRQMLTLLNSDKPVTADDIKGTVTSIMRNSGAPDNAIKQALAALPAGGTDRENRAFIARHATNSLSAESQLEKLFPAAVGTNVGGAVVPLSGGGPLAYTAPGTQVGPAQATTISPQVATNQITGAPMVIGGGRGVGTQPTVGGPAYGINAQAVNPVSGIGQPTAPLAQPSRAPMSQPSAQPPTQPQGQVLTQPVGQQPSQPKGGAQLQQLPNESPANFNARVAQVQNSFVKAQDQFNNTASEFGHIPTIKNINNNIISLLKDPDVNTGSVQNYLSKKLGKENLSAKEQELAKYLGQRVQNLSPKSDADAANKKEAYGSLQMKKEALMDLVRQDQAWVTSQELQAKGVLNNGGSATNPNFGRVAEFNNTFTQFASDPSLMKYISIIGENPDKAQLDKSDIADLQKEFGSMTPQKRQEMELKRKTLLRLVNGGK
jgi:hypothetical protein